MSGEGQSMSTSQRVSRAFHRLGLLLAAIVLAGCSDNTEHELAACKLKAMDRWPEKISCSEHDGSGLTMCRFVWRPPDIRERLYQVAMMPVSPGFTRPAITEILGGEE